MSFLSVSKPFDGEHVGFGEQSEADGTMVDCQRTPRGSRYLAGRRGRRLGNGGRGTGVGL